MQNSNEAMREALEAALKTIRGVINGTISPRSNTVFDCRDKLSAALALPRRQCDVGTAEEQEERCWRHYLRSEEPMICPTVISGALKWSQMPYEEGGAS